MANRKRPKISWSDDLSHDSEEEKERERLAQIERELAAAPKKPVYAPEDLQFLIKSIIDMTTLYDLREEDWTQEAKQAIEDWILEPRALVLSIYFLSEKLRAISGIPIYPVYDLTYFLRAPDYVFKVDTFHDDIVFGTFVDSVESNMIEVLENMYAPYFFAITTWPDSVKSEFCCSIHTFLAKLTDMYYKMLGLTVLYIPREGQHLSFEKASADRELVKRLEGVVVYWTHQIKSCLEDQAFVSSQNELLCPSDEYDFWIYRHENLNAVRYQLKNPAVRHITKILVTTHSTFIHQFQSLCDEINQKIVEATSNIEYLQVIKHPCAVLECVVDPDEIAKHIPQIINLFRFIWTESPYYNSEHRITNLFKALSNQIIILCKAYINLEDLFEGSTKKAMGEFTKCIECCKKYREIYDLMVEAHNEKKPDSWVLDTGSIFNYIDSFVQRCFDMLDVCNCMIIFGRMDEMEVISKPLFSGARGDQFEEKCSSIEHMFQDALRNVRQVSSTILDVQAPSWYDDVLQFRTVVKDIEIIIENLVESVFEGVNHVEEAVVALYSLNNYSKRKSLRRIFKRKTAEVWAMFSDKVQETKKDLVSCRNMYPADLPSFAGRAVVLRMRKNRLMYLKKVMTDASVWLLPCSNSEDVIMHVNRLVGAIDLAIRDLFVSWTHNFDERCGAGLNKTLMRRSAVNPGLLECNIDVNILDLCKESGHWEGLGIDIPMHASQVYVKSKNVLFVYESVLAVVKGYNKILDSLSDEERLLFKPLTSACEKKVQPGIFKLTWTSTMSDAYIADCVAQIGELQDFLTTYKNCNVNLVKIMEKICDTPFVEFDIYNVYEIKDLREEIRVMENLASEDILNMYKEIVTYLVIVYEGFEANISQMAEYWVKYVRRFDRLLEDALRLAMKATMQNMYKCVHGDGTMAPSPLIKMNLYLTDKEITHIPTSHEIRDTFTTILDEIVHIMSKVPRLFEKFALPGGGLKRFCEVIQVEPDCNMLQTLIDTEIEYNITLVAEHIKMWDPYAHIWKVDKEEFMVKYREEKHPASDFDALIIDYSNLANTVQIQETVNQIHFITLNSSELKKSIIAHCLKWQVKLGELLRAITEADIDVVYAYVEKSSEDAMKMPADLKELASAIATYERLVSDVSNFEKTFPPISDQMATLAKFEVELSSDMVTRHENIPVVWAEYLALLEEAKKALELNKDKFKTELLEQAEEFKEAAKEFCEDFYNTAPVSSDVSGKDAMAQLKAFREQLNALRAQEQQIRDGLAVFNLTTPVNLDLQRMEKELEKLEEVWGLVFQWEESWEKYKTQTFWEMETDEMEDNVMFLFRNFNRLSRQLKDKGWDIIDTTRVKVDAFRRTLPLIGDLKNPCMRERHWDRIKVLMGVEFDQNSEDFKLELIMRLNFQAYAEDIAEISNAATMELNIENGLKTIREIWKGTTYEMQHHKGEMYKIKNVEDVMQFLEDHQVQLSSMKSTKYVEPFIKEVDYWEKALGYVAECIEISLQVQRRYLYLESIFSGEDIRKQLPSEVQIFDALTADWTEITSNMFAGANAIEACIYKPMPYLYNKLNKMVDNLDGILRALEKYLETKRMLFPRFYFISNDDLLEILGNSKKPQLIQVHLKKLFDNVNKIRIDKNALGLPVAKAMMSEDGECIEWKYNLILDGPAEVWLLGLEHTMRVVLREQLILTRAALRKCKYQREQWINDWPGQLGITCSKIQWTSDCTRTLCRCELMKEKKPMKKLRKKQNQILTTLQMMSRKDISKILRAKVNALCVIEIHSRDMVDKMYKMGCMTVTAFEWFSQLKFYWDREREDCYIRQTNTNSVYTYEYIGNSGRLVITPLTDRCYITLTTALHLFRGGSPQGPAGTGKTETTKDLGRALARWVVVTNCSDGLDYKSMAKCFAGIAQSGCWGCFDEFNRINIEVLSVVAQQILAVLLALSQLQKKFVFEGCEIKLDSNCGIFITMNPGYAGRTELPDNLKSMFRPIAMCVPDCLIIAENTLFSDGFTAYKINAKKVFTLYQLAMQQLSKQDHYDFGLRSMVALLRYAGVKRRAYPNLPEQEMVILAMRDMNVARLTAKDVPLFDGIMQDIFPDVEVPTLDYEMLETAISAEMKLVGLQPVRAALHKVIQTFETKNSRHSSILLGDTNTAKTVSWKMLAATLSRLAREKVPGFINVQVFPMNPKALTLGELYGEYNLATGEWKDGVLSSIMRNTCQDESPDQKWIIFDGPVDAIWIENLNSVMDDNKLLTLVNSERISMPAQVSLLIETLDLAVASPATVSRNGMVYNDYRDWGWWPFVNSWLDTVDDPEYKEMLRRHFLLILTPVLELKRLHLSEGASVRGQELTGVRALCRLLALWPPPAPPQPDEEDNENFSKMRFLFAMIWSVCSTLEDEPRRKLDNWVREHEGIFPLKDTVYDYYVDERLRQFKPWEDKLPDNWRFNPNLGFHMILVPTVEFIRVQIIALDMLVAGYGVIVGGPTGTGKTFLIQGTLASLDPSKYSQQVLNMSAQTTAANVQDIIEARLEKRTKGNYVPAGGKKMIAFMDDINMPVRDNYGSQPPLELVRLWHDYGYWYDRAKQWRKNVKDMVLCAAAGPPGGARSPLPPRLLSCFHPFYLTPPTHSQLVKIFGTMLSQHLMEFDEETKTVGKVVLVATIDMFNNIVAKLLPTPSKMHYLFNLRDISKIFQGLLRSNKDYTNTKARFLRLWIHECFRVFGDRLTEEKDRDWFMNQVGDMLGKHFELTFHALCPSKSPPLFGHFLNPFEVYDDIVDPAALRKYILNQMEEYNSCPGVVKMELVLFKDAIEHIVRIVRVVSQPRGHVLCVGIGGSGRQSLTRVASYICECNSFQVVVTKTYGIKDFREDLKLLYTSTGVDAKKTTFIFSDTQIVEDSFTEIINNLLSSGEVTNLFKPDEFEDIKSALEKPMKNANIMQTAEAVQLFLIDRVRTNLHIVLCFSPIGDQFRNRIRQYPALINATTTNWFLEWPREALLEVAYKFLEGVELLASITGPRIRRKESLIESREDGLRASVASIMSLIHSSVGKYSVKMWLEMRRTNYVTPTNYLELVSGYKEMLKMKRSEIALQANKLRNGLGKVAETTTLVGQMSEELAVSQVQVAEYTEQCIEYMGVINVQQRNADEQQRSVAARSKKTMEEEVQCKKLAEAAMRDLASAMPALEEAVKALDALNKKDITEVKSYAKPPQKVEMVLEAVLILLQKEPTWAEAKRQLGDQYFLDKLREFDKDNISDKTLKKIGTYTAKPEFEPEIIGMVSTAAKSLCLWVRAIEKYGKVYKIVKPKKERLEEALESLRMKQQILAEARAKLRELSEMIARLQKEYDEKVAQKEELERKARMLQLKLERAEALITGLSGERERWELTVERLDKEFANLPGDCLIATGFVAYLGPFVSEYREDLMGDWFREVYNEQLPVTMDLSMKYFLLDDATLRDWNYMGLPDDNFSAENGIIVVRATRWPLAVDPQGQALIWISRLEEKSNIEIVDFGQPNYLKIMETCLQEGKPVLVQNVGEVLEPSIQPVLDKAIVRIGKDLVIKFNEKMVPYNPNFRMYLTTKLGNPAYTPEILTKTTMVNFAVKEQGLTSQLLGIVVRKERPQLELMKDNLVMTIANNKKVLVDLENDLLRIMYESQVPLLENEELFITLQTSQRTSLEVKEALITSQETEKEIDTARQGYVPVAVRASVLFFALNDLSRIDPMYQFSLDAYTDLFMYSIDRSPKGGELEDRINNLNEFHTYSVYKNTCRALFERHKLLLSFHMVSRILFQMGKMSMHEYLYLLKGGIVLDRSEQPENPTNWMPEDCWDNITELDKLPGFHGVQDAFETFSKEWKEWYLHPEPESQPLIGEWNDICNEFQRILWIRALRVDRVSACVAAFVTSVLGGRYVEPPVLDIKMAWEESSWKTSLLFVLSPGVDPTAALIQLARDVKMEDKFHSLSLGQGQAPTATRMLSQGMKEGGWVFLANCHLACEWLGSLRGFDNPRIHPRFRLWLSSMPDDKFPLNVLQRSIKMTTEPPQGLKGNLVRIFANMNEDKFDEATPKYRRLLFCVSFFHCTLIARKRFRQLGYNAVYSFNDADFDVSDNLLANYLEEYEEVPWDALRYLFAIINYGGHITDDWDKRVLIAYINQFFCEEAYDTPFYRLSSIPAYHIPRDGSLESYRDFLDLLPAYERAESVGQHASADVATLAQDALIMCRTLFALASTGGGGGGGGEDQKVDELALEMMQKLPNQIDVETTEKMMGPEIVMPMCVSLLQEIGYFNVLIGGIVAGLKELRRAIEGLVVMSEILEDMYTCIFEGRVPTFWRKGRPSMKPLGAWCRELALRGAHLQAWAAAPRSPPTLCWLPALVVPTGFLTAVMQTTARAESWPIDTLCWEFTVLPLEEASFVRPPRDGGVYIRGQYLEGASWFKKEGYLQEPLPMQLVFPMTPIHFKPIRATGRRMRNRYICPCYYYPARMGAFVVAVDMPAGKESSDFWVKRGTALLCTLAT
ncbi:dynein axonemal heavy chain 2 isoform X1 [Plodia interpunctella]|uniref:dynein axonemal heavy chain 2 isoform X1 n=2 Tax=Plodia interpunctella TaxID=58824 RepID=UPI002368EB0C|nr:dynein axonemal heavy chain 2 isoform X1 [Plodia interpunctella]